MYIPMPKDFATDGDTVHVEHLKDGKIVRDLYETVKGGAVSFVDVNGFSTFIFTVALDTGDLTVSKTVAGEAGEKDKAFNFSVVLGDTKISGTYGDMKFVNGVATFTLKHGESKTAAGLPAGTTYKVVERAADQDGYETTSTGAEGAIENGKTAAANFVNTKEPEPDVPKTGDRSHPEIWLAMMAVSMMGLAAITFAEKKKVNNK